jgi:hypothetical protein
MCGHYLGCHRLQPVDTATTVRVRNSKVTVTDGPFAETKEQLAGFCLIDARDLNEAIQVASRIPPARTGSIEVRPVRELAAPADAGAPRPAVGDASRAARRADRARTRVE